MISTLLLLASGLSIAMTLIAERMAVRLGVVSHPKADRWHRQSVPLLGGVAILVATVVSAPLVAGRAPNVVALVTLAGAMALVGLGDDLFRLSPSLKLLAQLLLGGVLLYTGFALRLTGFPARGPAVDAVLDRRHYERFQSSRLICIESTTYPGTTEEVVLAQNGPTVGRDVFLACSPEREDPGHVYSTATNPKLLGGVTPACAERAALYSQVIDHVVPVSAFRRCSRTSSLAASYVSPR